MKKWQIENLKKSYPPGTRLQLKSGMISESDMPKGTKGTVDLVDDIGSIHCAWDNNRSLAVIPGEDSYEVIKGIDRLTEDVLALMDVDEEQESALEELNKCLDGYNAEQYRKLDAACKRAIPDNKGDDLRATQLTTIANNLDDFNFIPNITSHINLARHLISHSANLIGEEISDYFDYDAYGYDIAEAFGGMLTDYGYIEYGGAESLDELLKTGPEQIGNTPEMG